jgi:microspherule protein 1
MAFVFEVNSKSVKRRLVSVIKNHKENNFKSEWSDKGVNHRETDFKFEWSEGVP